MTSAPSRRKGPASSPRSRSRAAPGTPRWVLPVLVALALLGVPGVAHAGPPAEAAPVARPASADDETVPGRLNLRTASAQELERLKGIGPAKARAIIAHRRIHPFRRLEDLIKVRGIGRKTFVRLRPFLTLTDAPARKATSPVPQEAHVLDEGEPPTRLPR